jgi:methionyl aminopeptidase
MIIKTDKEIEEMKKGGQILKSVIDELEKEVIVGKKTIDIEKKAIQLISKYGKANFKGQNGFPFSTCISINEEIVHGLPSERIIKEGDIVSIDTGIFFPLNLDKEKYPNIYKGYHTDMARTFIVGEVDSEVKRLVQATKKMLKIGIKKVRPGITLGDLGETMQRYAEKQGFGIVRELCGHGIGKDLHEDPQILNYGERHRGQKIQKGMVFCIEPMLTMGTWEIKLAKDQFAYKTKDDSLSAHFEDMIAVTDEGCIILTK